LTERDEDFAVAARTRLEARGRERDRKAERRDRWNRILLWLCAPLLFPAAGAAAATAVIEHKSGLALFVASFLVPAALTLWLARRRGWFERVAWPLVTIAATLALMFWAGFVWLGYGPG